MKQSIRTFLIALMASLTFTAVQAKDTPMDVGFNELVKRLVDAGAITGSNIETYGKGSFTQYQFQVPRTDLKLITNYRDRVMRPNVANAYRSIFRTAGTEGDSQGIGYGEDNSQTYYVGMYKDRNYAVVYLRDPSDATCRYVYTLTWWESKGKGIEGVVCKFYGLDPVVQRKAKSARETRIVVSTGDDSLAVDSNGTMRYYNLGALKKKNVPKNSAEVLAEISKICSAYTNISGDYGAATSSKAREEYGRYRLVLANRLVSVCNLYGRTMLGVRDRRAAMRLIKAAQDMGGDQVTETLFMSAKELLTL